MSYGEIMKHVLLMPITHESLQKLQETFALEMISMSEIISLKSNIKTNSNSNNDTGNEYDKHTKQLILRRSKSNNNNSTSNNNNSNSSVAGGKSFSTAAQSSSSSNAYLSGKNVIGIHGK